MNINNKKIETIIVFVLIFATVILMLSCEKQEYKLRIYDKLADEPIYNALIYNKTDAKAYSSDYNGYVTLPHSYKGEQISIDAYGYKSKKIILSESEDIVMEVKDSEKSGESQFTDEEKVMTNYNEYRINNDITYYDLSLDVDDENNSIEGVNKISFKALRFKC